MICPRCYGKHVVVISGAVVPCPECGGLGELHCCDGLQEQNCEAGEKTGEISHRGTEAQRRQKQE
jgi:hypothetical protein